MSPVASPPKLRDTNPYRVLASCAPFLVISSTFAAAVTVGWRQWGDLFTDTGRELELPRRLLGSERLYADLRYYYGPLAPYLNAALYRIFGVHADVMMWAGIASAAVMAWIIWLLSRHTGRLGATLAAIAFVVMCAFQRVGPNPAIFNWVMPYTYATTYGMIAASASLALLLRHLDAGKPALLAWSVVFLVVAGLAKFEVFLPSAAAHVVFVFGMVATRRLTRVSVLTYTVGAAALCGVYAALSISVGETLWTENLLGVANAASRRFVLSVLGLLDPAASFRNLGLSLGAWSATIALAVVLPRLTSCRGAIRLLPWIGVVVVFGVFACWGETLAFPAIPWVTTLVGAAALVKWFRTREVAALAVLLVAVFGFTALGRILFRPMPDHYGFYMLPVPLVAAAHLLFGALPPRAGPNLVMRHVASAVGAAMVAGTIGRCSWLSLAEYRRETVALETPRASLRIPRDYALASNIVADLARRAPGTRMIAVPQGVALTFLAGLEGGDGFFSYLPMEIPDEASDLALVERWRRRPPDLVLVIAGQTDEFGYRGFGDDYGEAAGRFVMSHYAVERAFASNVALFRLGSR